MIEIEQETKAPIRAYLVSNPTELNPGDTDASSLESTAEKSVDVEAVELQGLIKTLGLVCCGVCQLTRLNPTPKYGMGSGKAEEICHRAKCADADCIIFDFELSPTHQRNWENLSHIPVYDRQEVIIRIFSSRARTREACLQVELAKLQYSLPRLAHSYGDMARQRGGRYGSKGSGETQLELDKRGVQLKISTIKKELEKVKKNRSTQRKRREKVPCPVCSLVGYTNAGKSSLLNTLTHTDVYEKDELFATLDPTTRRLYIEENLPILLTDTVGFIRNLPHTLIEAFSATLEEANYADVLLIVVDASDPSVWTQYQTTVQVLESIKVNIENAIVVVNKIDLVTDDFTREHLKKLFPLAVFTSTRTRDGLDLLKKRLKTLIKAK